MFISLYSCIVCTVQHTYTKLMLLNHIPIGSAADHNANRPLAFLLGHSPLQKVGAYFNIQINESYHDTVYSMRLEWYES